MNTPVPVDFLKSLVIGLEPVIKRRIADELYPIMDEIIREEIAKIGIRLTQTASFEGNRLIITVEDRRK